MKERNGVRLGQRVRDLDGKDLGKVTKLREWGFETVKGLPVLIRDEHVFRYEDVHGREGDTLLVARGENDIFLLAEGKLPASWRVVGAGAGFPTAASPGEGARLTAHAKGRK